MLQPHFSAEALLNSATPTEPTTEAHTQAPIQEGAPGSAQAPQAAQAPDATLAMPVRIPPFSEALLGTPLADLGISLWTPAQLAKGKVFTVLDLLNLSQAQYQKLAQDLLWTLPFKDELLNNELGRGLLGLHPGIKLLAAPLSRLRFFTQQQIDALAAHTVFPMSLKGGCLTPKEDTPKVPVDNVWRLWRSFPPLSPQTNAYLSQQTPLRELFERAGLTHPWSISPLHATEYVGAE